MSYLAPRQKATLPGLPILGKPSTSYPRRASPFFETELPSLVPCETIEWFPYQHWLRSSFLFFFSTKSFVVIKIVETSCLLLRIYWSPLFSLAQSSSSYLL